MNACYKETVLLQQHNKREVTTYRIAAYTINSTEFLAKKQQIITLELRAPPQRTRYEPTNIKHSTTEIQLYSNNLSLLLLQADIRQQSNSSGGATLSYTHGENRTYEERKAKEVIPQKHSQFFHKFLCKQYG